MRTALLLSGLVFLAAPPLAAQDLLLSLRADAPSAPALLADEEVLALPAGGGLRPVLTTESWNVLVGDADGDGILADGPADLDALHVAGPGGISSWFLSTTTTLQFPNGAQVLDGDVFYFDGAGGVVVAWPEAWFEAATGTTGVDVDAFAADAAGTLWFSFAEDEPTSSTALAAQNGGNPVLDEQTVFRVDPGLATAVIHFTQAQVVGFFGAATGTTPSTVVDITGLAPDPQGAPGDLLMVCDSTSQALVGRVVTSRGGGLPFLVGGLPVEPGLMGLASPVPADALALAAEPLWPVLRALPEQGSAGNSDPGLLFVTGLQPGAAVQLVATYPVLPGPFLIPVATGGFGSVAPDPTHPGFAMSLASPGFSLVADAQGEASFSFDFGLLPPGARAVVQAVTVASGRLSTPAPVAVLP